MKISIALATYNGAANLQAQLDSYLSQDRLPDELVACDDVSTDETVEILKTFRNIASFEVTILENSTNLGFTNNFGKVIANCSGDLIFLSDQDDIWFPEKIRIVEDTFKKNPGVLLITHDGDLVDGDLVSYGTTKRGQVVAGYGSDDHLCTGALTAVSKELIQYALPIPNGIVGHDGWLHNFARSLEKRMVLKQSLQQIRRHSQNTSAWVASSVTPINKFTVAKSQFTSKPANSYQDRLVINANLIERLESIDHNVISASSITVSLDHLKDEHKALVHREGLVKLNFLQRKVAALKMLALGDYAYFNGWKSFLRDMCR